MLAYAVGTMRTGWRPEIPISDGVKSCMTPSRRWNVDNSRSIVARALRLDPDPLLGTAQNLAETQKTKLDKPRPLGE